VTGKKSLIVDGVEVPINGERNLLEVIRKANIDIPTFCYHSELSVYGACRMCLVDVEGRGLMASCSTAPEKGMKIKTSTEEIREIRKIAVELLLANHGEGCTTCGKSQTCKLQSLAKRLGIEKVRFRQTHKPMPVDATSPSIVRDPNKCILCGDCVRVCREIQGVGAIDFAYRGSKVAVLPAYGKDMAKVECIYCGQCASACPTGALTPKSEVKDVWKALHDPGKKVVAQIAPAVRVALGEEFGLAPGVVTTGQMVAALKKLGFHKVYDTSFTADLTILEEGTELLNRLKEGKNLPQFTSCCPGWIKFAEQYYPGLLPRLSSCKSPQQMLGSLLKDALPKEMGITREDLIVVSIMPCTAKKFEARRPEFKVDGVPDVDFVLTTQELARMIDEAGIMFTNLHPESLDMPFGFKTGAGVIFGNSGGVMEAALRYAYEVVTGTKLEAVDFEDVRGSEGLRSATIVINGTPIKVGIVHGLANARRVCEDVLAGKCDYHFIEVMTCPRGCIGGAGQPVTYDHEAKDRRTRGLYEADKMLELHKSQDNPYVTELYEKHLGSVGSEKAHHLLHTHYKHRRRITDEDLSLVSEAASEKVIQVSVCVGTSCYLKGSQNVLRALIKHIENEGVAHMVDVKATFCFERCGRGPTVQVGETVIEKCTFEKAREALAKELEGVPK
jgi:NADH-quinone oxidoreductase subunit G